MIRCNSLDKVIIHSQSLSNHPELKNADREEINMYQKVTSLDQWWFTGNKIKTK